MQGVDVGQPIQVTEWCSPAQVRRVAAMLDVSPDALSEGTPLPRGWHFFLLAGETRRSMLRPDGFPGLGVPLPDLGLPRLLLGGRTVLYTSDILIGSAVERTSFIKQLTEKTSAFGPMAIVTIQHELRPVAGTAPALIETQTYVLLGGTRAPSATDLRAAPPVQAAYQRQLTPDETLLFQYSALGFNSHKIHLDRTYARTVEGLPDLVVNGGLTTLLLTEFIRTELGRELTDVTIKHVAPLFCNRPLTLTADERDTDWRLGVYDEQNRLAITMDATLTQPTHAL